MRKTSKDGEREKEDIGKGEKDKEIENQRGKRAKGEREKTQ